MRDGKAGIALEERQLTLQSQVEYSDIIIGIWCTDYYSFKFENLSPQ